jgi:PhnB protein
MPVRSIPEGYHSVTPYLIVDDAAAAIDFYTRAFGATEKFRMPMPAPSGVEGGGKIGHAELLIGDSHVMLADEFPDMGHLGPKARGGATASLLLYVDDVDSAFQKAIAAGAKELRALETQFWGDRMGTLTDPFGHVWSLATHVEEVAPDEMERRMKEWSAGQKQGEPAE